METNGWISTMIVVLVLVSVSYSAGRLQQWIRRGRDRDEAYRDGYNEATESLFGLAVKARQPVTVPDAPAPAPVPAQRRSRHSHEDAQARTVRLSDYLIKKAKRQEQTGVTVQ